MGPMANAPFPIPAHRTGRADFRHPALRPASSPGYRRWPKMHASKVDDSEIPDDIVTAEPSCSPSLHLCRSPPSPCNTASSAGSGACRAFPGSSPITASSPASKARQKSGSFPPPELPGFSGTMTLSDTRRGRRSATTSRPLPSPRCGSPPLPGSPSRRAVPITPADQTGARVGCFPIRAAFPVIQAGRRPRFHFRGLLRLHSRYGPSGCSTAQGGLCHEASTRPVAQPGRSSATRATDSSLGGTLLHW